MIKITNKFLLILNLNLINSINSQILKSNQVKSCSNSISSLNSLTLTESLINFDTVYAQLDSTGLSSTRDISTTTTTTVVTTLSSNNNNNTGNLLRIVLIGSTSLSNPGYSNSTNFLTTLVVNSEVLTFTISANQSSLCNAIRTLGNPGGNSSTTNLTSTSFEGCPYGPGVVAIGFTIPLANNYALTTITAQVVILSPDLIANHLACVDLNFTPYYPKHFAYSLIHYFPIGLLAIYFLLYLIARGYASHTNFIHENESKIAASLTLALSSTNLAMSKRGEWFGAWAGRQVVGSGSLRRYVTVELREIWQIMAWFTLVGTTAVNWPDFAYPVFAQSAWSALIYNATLPFTLPASPLLPVNSTGPVNFASQISNRTSPLFLDPTLPPVLLDLTSSNNGIMKWSQTIGVRSQDLFGICTFTFLLICAIIIVVHLFAAGLDYLVDIVWPSRTNKARSKTLQTDTEVSQKDKPETSSEDFSSKEILSTPPLSASSRNGQFSRMSAHDGWGEEEEDEVELDDGPRPEDDFPSWQLHLALLQGNLTRALLLFHLPLSLFSIYQISIHATSPLSSTVLASFTLAIICVSIPAFLLYRVHIKSVDNLFTSLPILLSIGPLYNTYSDECTMFSTIRFLGNLLLAIVIGALQSYGTAQSAVILFVEVTDTLVTSLWLPWADNTAMGPLAFILSISRIIIAVLLVVLSPAVAVSDQAGAWLAYIVFLMQALVALLLLIGVIFKLLELLVRFFGPVPFDESPSGRAGGLSGALRKWDRAGKGGNRSNSNSNSNNSGKTKKQLEAKRKRLQLASGGERRFSASETSTLGDTRSHRNLNSPQPLLQTSGGVSRASSYADRGGSQSAFSPSNRQQQQQQLLQSQYSTYPTALDLGNDDAIMSAMTLGPWAGGGTTGYVPPGAYNSGSPHGSISASGQQPILRSNPAWRGDQITVVTSSTSQISPIIPSTGFTRVGGGRSSSSNPYNVVPPSHTSTLNNPNSTTTGYPPYPISSADHYSLPPSPIQSSPNQSIFQSQPLTSSNQPTNPRRLSQSAVIEMASNNFDSIPPLPSSTSNSIPPLMMNLPTTPPGGISRHQPRTSISLLPTINNNNSSNLLSNSVSTRYSIDSPNGKINDSSKLNPNGVNSSSNNKSKGGVGVGFFGRFRKGQKSTNGNTSDLSSDDEDSDDDDEEESEGQSSNQSGVKGKLKNFLVVAGGGGRKKSKGKEVVVGREMEEEEMEELASPVVGDGQDAPAKTFVVTRKPRPSAG